MINFKLNLTIVLIMCSFALLAQNEPTVTVKPKVFEHALNNPLKGFRSDVGKVNNHPYNAIVRHYLKWNVLERDASDGIERILEICKKDWAKLAQMNSKVIPRVYLDWDQKLGNEYWPSDMQTGDYESEQFKQRVEKLIEKLGQAWDNDSHVAWIQLGIIGYWGEHHSPYPTEWQQKMLGDLFTKHFKNKKVLVRYPHKHFKDYNFGFYWDRFGDTKPGMEQGIEFIKYFPDRWKTTPNEGEVGYGAKYGDANPGNDPDDSLTDSTHRAHLINWIRKLHATGCGWISNYSLDNPAVVAGAEELQKVFGYRFLLKEVTYPTNINNNKQFSVSFKVENVGSAPFYYNWPVELRLLDSKTREVKWKQIFNSVEIRDWMPGEKWNEGEQQYDVPAPIKTNIGTFNINVSLPKGKYILALAILDPAGMVPSVKFATNQYFNGGNHPIGYIGIDTNIDKIELDSSVYDNPIKDKSLYYKVMNSTLKLLKK